MSIKLKQLIESKPKQKIIAEGLFSKLKSLFGFGDKKVKKLKKDKKFMNHVKRLNKHYDNMANHIEKVYGQKVSFEKFTPKDFK